MSVSLPVGSVLLVYKKSARGNPRRFRAARRAHRRTLAEVRRMLRRKGIPFKAVYRARLVDYAPYDGVISVGGDGTFLEASHGVRGQWILGINSDPRRSAGTFCAADRSSAEKILDRILQGKGRIRRLERLQVEINGKRVGVPVLNDILVTHRKPAAMSRYWIRVGKIREDHRSSGLWISTAAGSTGAIRSAGGRRLRRESRALVYRPRELYRPPGCRYRLTGGVVPSAGSIRVGSLMREGWVCLDGEHWTFPFSVGDRLSLRRFPCPLRVVR